MMLVAAERSHIPALAENMRAMDRMECEAFGKSPEDALHDALTKSLWAVTALVDDHPEAMMGVVTRNMIEGVGVPWMLGSDRIYASARELVTYGPAIIAEMERPFARLENLVSVANDRAIRFLKHWGWRISSDRVPVGGVEFVGFSNV